MQIKFYPESDLVDLGSAVQEYQNIWDEDGQRIVQVWEKITNLKFKETFINASVSDQISGSHPLNLRYNVASNNKKSILVHELGHRILYRRVDGMKKVDSIARHKFLYFVLHDVFLELYGEDFLKEAIEFEGTLSEKYKVAWDFVLKYSKEERFELFKKVLEGDLSIIS